MLLLLILIILLCGGFGGYYGNANYGLVGGVVPLILVIILIWLILNGGLGHGLYIR